MVGMDDGGDGAAGRGAQPSGDLSTLIMTSYLRLLGSSAGEGAHDLLALHRAAAVSGVLMTPL